MTRNDCGIALREIETLFRTGTLAGVGDGALLDRFISDHGEVAEAAFATLVDRHGPMVLRVCRGALKDRNDAEDAFQATFLALLRGARSIRNRDSVASWLHGTALRVSAYARLSGAKRKAHEGRSAASTSREEADPERDDLRAVIVEEVARLPERYRMAVVLCDLEGLSHDEAARSLGWPIGTIKSRISRGRERLKGQLVRRGLAPAVALVGCVVGQESRAAVRPSLAEATVRLAMGRRVSGTLSSALRLADLFQRSLIMGRIRIAVGVATLGVLAAGATLLAQQGPGLPGGAAEGGFTGPYKTIYAVPDLVHSVPEDRDGKRPPADMAPLIDLIRSTTAPGTWVARNDEPREQKGQTRVGTIQQFGTDLSLIVVQTTEGHAQVKQRLDQVRRLVEAREGGVKVDRVPAPDGGSGMGGMMGAGSGKESGSAGMMQGMRAGSAAPDGNQGSAMMGMTPMGSKGMSMGAGGSGMASGGSMMMGGMGSASTTEGKTEQRLRAVEEKLDRLLKVLDQPKPTPNGTLSR